MDNLYRKKYLKYKKKYLQLKQLEGAATANLVIDTLIYQPTEEYKNKKDIKLDLNSIDRDIFLDTLFVYLVRNKDKENIELNGIDAGKKFEKLYKLELSDSTNPKAINFIEYGTLNIEIYNNILEKKYLIFNFDQNDIKSLLLDCQVTINENEYKINIELEEGEEKGKEEDIVMRKKRDSLRRLTEISKFREVFQENLINVLIYKKTKEINYILNEGLNEGLSFSGMADHSKKEKFSKNSSNFQKREYTIEVKDGKKYINYKNNLRTQKRLQIKDLEFVNDNKQLYLKFKFGEISKKTEEINYREGSILIVDANPFFGSINRAVVFAKKRAKTNEKHEKEQAENTKKIQEKNIVDSAVNKYKNKKGITITSEQYYRDIFLDTLFVYLVKNKSKENIELNGIDAEKKFEKLYELKLFFDPPEHQPNKKVKAINFIKLDGYKKEIFNNMLTNLKINFNQKHNQKHIKSLMFDCNVKIENENEKGGKINIKLEKEEEEEKKGEEGEEKEEKREEDIVMCMRKKWDSPIRLSHIKSFRKVFARNLINVLLYKNDDAFTKYKEIFDKIQRNETIDAKLITAAEEEEGKGEFKSDTEIIDFFEMVKGKIEEAKKETSAKEREEGQVEEAEVESRTEEGEEGTEARTVEEAVEGNAGAGEAGEGKEEKKQQQ